MRILRDKKNNYNPDTGVFSFSMAKHWLEVLNKSHKEWVSMVRSFGEFTYSEDLVQETYLRIHQAKAQDRAVINGKANKGFMYIALKNNHINFSKEKAKVHKYQIEDFKMESRDEAPTEWYMANDKLEEKIIAVMENWHWYDRDMFILVATGPDSMRKISRDSRISLSSISNTIKKCRKRLRDELNEDFEDYFNNDYKQIK
tara:strand:- start:502 stop:1104 length:603 start_codon:yes stop_codon:yes gene_type:complete